MHGVNDIELSVRKSVNKQIPANSEGEVLQIYTITIAKSKMMMMMIMLTIIHFRSMGIY